MKTKQKSPTLRAVAVLRRGISWILLCVALAAGFAYTLSNYQKKKYTATALVVVDSSRLPQGLAVLSVGNGISDQGFRQSINLGRIALGEIAAKTAHRLGRGVSSKEVSMAVNVSAQRESNIVRVSATVSSAARAAAIANTYAIQWVTQQQDINHAYSAAELKRVTRQLAALSKKERIGAAGLALQNQRLSLGVLARMPSARIAQNASAPASSSSPAVMRNTLLGVLLGFVLGLSIVVVFARFDRRIREPRELAAIYRLPLLGIVFDSPALAHLPTTESRFLKTSNKALLALPPHEAEAFALIRGHVRYLDVDRDIRTLLVTSAARREGRTTVALQLAFAAARVGESVLLIEADLRNPTLADQLGAQPSPGLSDVLVGAKSLSSATQLAESLDLLVGGDTLPNPGELIDSAAMEALLERAKSTYDLVVIDSTPLTVVPDALPLLGKVDGVVIVGRLGHSSRQAAERLNKTCSVAAGLVLGVVANGVEVGHGGWSDYAQPEPTRGAVAAAPGDGPSSEEPTFGPWA